jgi:hypothetical protein
MTRVAKPDSWIALTLDLWSARALVWLAGVGREAELTQSAHLYFFDRYRRLAKWHRRRGRLDKAARLHAKAEQHFNASGGEDGPPYAAAMAMPRPRRFVETSAVSRRRLVRPSPPPDDAA